MCASKCLLEAADQKHTSLKPKAVTNSNAEPLDCFRHLFFRRSSKCGPEEHLNRLEVISICNEPGAFAYQNPFFD